MGTNGLERRLTAIKHRIYLWLVTIGWTILAVLSGWDDNDPGGPTGAHP